MLGLCVWVGAKSPPSRVKDKIAPESVTRVIFGLFIANPAIAGPSYTLRRLAHSHGSSNAARILQQLEIESLRGFPCHVLG